MVSRYATQMSPERRSSRYAVRSSRSPSALFSRRHSSFWLRTARPSSPAAQMRPDRSSITWLNRS